MSERSSRSGLTAVVLNFENPALTVKATQAILDAADGPETTIVVDNGSSPASFEQLRRSIPTGVEILRVEINEGIPSALNRGVDAALDDPSTGAVLIVMNDVLVTRTDFGQIRKCLAEPMVGAVAPVQCRAEEPDIVHTAGGLLDERRWVTSHRFNGVRRSELPDTLPPADFLDFSCVAINSGAWVTAGPLLSGFRFYWDDVEWSLRARDHGWQLRVVNTSCLHSVGGTMGTGVSPTALARSAHNRWATQRLRLRGRPGIGLVVAPSRELARLCLGRGRRPAVAAELRGWWDVFVRGGGPGEFRDD
jgi:GT2 family glycosyltransferase